MGGTKADNENKQRKSTRKRKIVQTEHFPFKKQCTTLRKKNNIQTEKSSVNKQIVTQSKRGKTK